MFKHLFTKRHINNMTKRYGELPIHLFPALSDKQDIKIDGKDYIKFVKMD